MSIGFRSGNKILGALPSASVPSPAVELVSSLGLGWKSIAVGRYITEPGEKPEITIADVVIYLASGKRVNTGERRDRQGRFKPYFKRPGAIEVCSEGSAAERYLATPIELTVCALDRTFVAAVAAEQEQNANARLQDQVNVHDDALASLIYVIEEEAKSGGPSGSLYIDYLAHALTIRLLSAGTRKRDERKAGTTLSRSRLRRVVERMEADLCADLDLQTLAIESGYSRGYFLRMFHAATGYTPHQYLLNLRVMRAQEMMKTKSMQLMDVALACGFSSHTHLSRVFREMVGVTPSEYRRDSKTR